MQFMQYAVLLCLFTDFHTQSLYCCKSGLQTQEEMGLNLPKEVLYALTILNRNASTELGRLFASMMELCRQFFLCQHTSLRYVHNVSSVILTHTHTPI